MNIHLQTLIICCLFFIGETSSSNAANTHCSKYTKLSKNGRKKPPSTATNTTKRKRMNVRLDSLPRFDLSDALDVGHVNNVNIHSGLSQGTILNTPHYFQSTSYVFN